MTCSMNMIKLLLIHFTFVVEIEPTGKKKRHRPWKKIFSVICESSSRQRESHLILLFYFSSILHLSGGTFVHDMIMMLKLYYSVLHTNLSCLDELTGHQRKIHVKQMQNAK